MKRMYAQFIRYKSSRIGNPSMKNVHEIENSHKHDDVLEEKRRVLYDMDLCAMATLLLFVRVIEHW